MNYQELISNLVKHYYLNGNDYPRSILYAIVNLVDGVVVDQFMQCDIERDLKGKLMSIDKPKTIYQASLDGTNFSITDSNNIREDIYPLKKINLGDLNVQIEDFTSLYMIVREAAFKSSLSNDEQEALKKIVIIYDSIFEEELREIYHRYAGSFFAWAYGMIEK